MPFHRYNKLKTNSSHNCNKMNNLLSEGSYGMGKPLLHSNDSMVDDNGYDSIDTSLSSCSSSSLLTSASSSSHTSPCSIKPSSYWPPFITDKAVTNNKVPFSFFIFSTHLSLAQILNEVLFSCFWLLISSLFILV
jgi:hypothetical protein